MSVTDLNAKRWERDSDPAKHDPLEALRAALRAVESGEAPMPTHVIVAFGRDDETGSSATRFFQSGTYRYHSQIGLLSEAAAMLRDNG